MCSGKTCRRMLTKTLMAVAILALAAPAFAQTGRLQGKVLDDQDKPVEGAKIVVSQIPDSGGRTWDAKTDKNGNYIFGTLPKSGTYLAIAEKEGVGTDEARALVRLNNVTSLNFKLSKAARLTAEQAAKNVAIKKLFEAGVVAAQGGNHQGAIDAFTQATVQLPTCADCYYNIAVSQEELKNWEGAEMAYKKAIENKPAYPEAYNGLAAMYTKQGKLDLAGEASVKAAEFSSSAAGGGSADSLFNAGVGMWNANKFPEAQQAFEGAIKSDPNLADAHFMLGKVLINLGKLPEAAAEYQAYLKLAPDGKYAAEAQTTFDALKPMLK